MATSSARVEFDGELMALRADLVAMTAAAAGAIMVATEALMQSGGASTEGADSVERACARIVELQGPVERRTGQLLARQQPVAGDLRLLISAFRISADAHRMGRLAHHIGAIAARRPLCLAPESVGSVIARMGQVAFRIADGAAVTLATGDAQDAARLEVNDDGMDELLRRLFSLLLDEWSYGVASAVDVALIGRFYERFADHAVAIAASVVFIVRSRPDTAGGPP